MNEVISAVRSGSVTYAVRTTNVDGIDVTVGDIMGLDEHSVLTTGKEVTSTTVELLEKLVHEDTSNITLFYGEGVTEPERTVEITSFMFALFSSIVLFASNAKTALTP